MGHRHWYYYSTIRLILICHPSEGGRLSRPKHCSKCAARAQSCVSQWFSWKHKLLSAARFEPGPSRAAGKRATTRPLRPVVCYSKMVTVLVSLLFWRNVITDPETSNHPPVTCQVEDEPSPIPPLLFPCHPFTLLLLFPCILLSFSFSRILTFHHVLTFPLLSGTSRATV